MLQQTIHKLQSGELGKVPAVLDTPAAVATDPTDPVERFEELKARKGCGKHGLMPPRFSSKIYETF